MPQKKQLRIQVQPSGKKAKPKPRTIISWDCIHDPLLIVQNRFKTVQSLRDPKTKAEFTLAELQSLSDKTIIIGSTEPSEIEKQDVLPAAGDPPKDDTHVTSTNDTTCGTALPAQLEDGLKLTKHARERMHQRDITKEQVSDCYDEATKTMTMSSTGAHAASASVGTTAIVLGGDDMKTVVTAIATDTDILPFEPDHTLVLQKCGLLREMRSQLGIGIDYNTELKVFEFSGNGRALELAKRRLLNDSGVSIVKVPSLKDCCGKIIGTGGRTIKRIQQLCNIPGHVNVSWDEESKHMILLTPQALDEQNKGSLYRIVDDIVHNRPWEGGSAYLGNGVIVVEGTSKGGVSENAGASRTNRKGSRCQSKKKAIMSTSLE
jgi:hypothetical protein